MEITDDTLAWLLDSDPAVRWQVLQDLTDASPVEVAAERSRVAVEGIGARLLGLQEPDGRWDGGTYRPGWVDRSRPMYDAWTATHFTMQSLREYGVDPSEERVANAVSLVRDVHWEWDGGLLYFEGEEEPCANGVVLANAVYFGEDGSKVLGLLLEGQLGDGGWNCETDTDVSSFHSTICALDGLLAWERAAAPGDPRTAEVRHARERGEEYLLERRLLWRRSTGELVDPRMAMPSWPTRWYYDVLRALDHLRLSRPEGDPRVADAVELLRGKADADGRWSIENEHGGPTPFRIPGEREGEPSRWVTLKALRVLRWAASWAEAGPAR